MLVARRSILRSKSGEPTMALTADAAVRLRVSANPPRGKRTLTLVLQPCEKKRVIQISFGSNHKACDETVYMG